MKRTARRAPARAYTFSRRQLLWLFTSFLVIGAADIFLGLSVVPLIPHDLAWRVMLAQYALLFAYLVILVLLLQMARQAKRLVPLLRFTDNETGEAFTPVGDEMEA